MYYSKKIAAKAGYGIVLLFHITERNMDTISFTHIRHRNLLLCWYYLIVNPNCYNANCRKGIFMEEKKGRSHFLCEKMPALAIVLSVFIITVLLAVAELPVEGVLKDKAALHNLYSVLVAIIILFIIKLWFSPSYKGALKLSISQGDMIKILIPVIVYAVASEIVTIITGDFVFEPSLTKLCMALNAGFSEETMFRAAAIPIGLMYFKAEKKIASTLIITSIVFGAMHFVNITGGGAVSVILMQVIATIFMGIYFAVLFMVSGSILLPIIVHALWDYLCFVTDGSLDNGIMTQAAVNAPLIVAVLFNVAIGIVAIIIAHSNKDKITQIWNEKWSK